MLDDLEYNFVRLEKAATDSWLTQELPYGMTSRQIDEYIAQYFPGWEFVSAALDDPDCC